MKVILTKDVPNTGLKGEVLDVSPGFARNYLLPKGLAVEASPGRLKDLEMRAKMHENKSLKEKEEAQKMASQLEGRIFRFQMKAGEEGRLFGSVTSSDIAEALAAEGFAVDRKKIDLPEPIKALGNHKVEVQLYSEVKAEVNVTVEKEE